MKKKHFNLILILLFSFSIVNNVFSQFDPGTQKNIDSLNAIIKQNPSSLNAASAYVALSDILYLSNADTIMPLCQKALAITDTYLNEDNEPALKIRALALNNLGYFYDNYGNTAKALEYYLEGFKIRENIKDDNGVGESLNNVGATYKKLGNNTKALEYYEKSLLIRKLNGDKKGIANVCKNMAVLYDEQGNKERAKEFYLNSLKIYEELGDEMGIGVLQYNLGVIFYDQKDYKNAIEYYTKSLKNSEKVDDKKSIANTKYSIAIVLFEQDQKNIKRAKELALSSLELSNELGSPEDIMNASGLLYKFYKIEQNWNEALMMHEIYTEMKDSLFNDEQTQKAVRAEMNYEFDKKEQSAKLLQEKKDELAQEKLKQQTRQRNWFVIGFVLMLALTIVSYRNYRNKRKAHEVIAIQKELVEVKNKDILDSINYAKRIQDALLKEEEHISEFLPQHFILFKPKDIVSGDFYWSIEKQGYLYFAAVDCTGHGVPGAFMSMLGISFLNEITADEILLSPAEILNSLREKIIKDLRQTGKEGESKDGMDISLMRINLSTKEVQWSGANNPLWIINSSTNELKEIKADRQPIGFHHNQKPFTNHSTILKSEETVYLFTDGYADQFGGENGKKYMTRNFKNLLAKINSKPMQEQKNILSQTLESWRGSFEQVDDVCVIGLRAS